MKYLKTYEGLTKWAPFHDKLKELFKIIGYTCYYFPSMGGNPLRVNFNLIAIPGSLSYCIIQEKIEQYQDPNLETKYQNPNNKLEPKDDDGTHHSMFSTSIDDKEPDVAYSKFINNVIDTMQTFTKIRVDTALDTYITDIIKLQIETLQSNINYTDDIIIPKNVCNELLTFISKYTKPHKLISDMQKKVPALYSEIKKIMGDTNLQNSTDMHGMGYSD